MNAWELLPLLRELFSRNPEYRYREPWEHAWLLFALGYSDRLEDETAIESARDVALMDRGGEAA